MRENEKINHEECVQNYCGDISKIENYDKAIADKTQVCDCYNNASTTYNPLITCDVVLRLNSKISCYYL